MNIVEGKKNEYHRVPEVKKVVKKRSVKVNDMTFQKMVKEAMKK